MKRYIRSDYIFGMANLTPKRTGLGAQIWSDHSGAKRNKPDVVPRVKIGVDDDEISVSISSSPEVLAPKTWKKKFTSSVLAKMEEAIKYIARNYDLFLKHYNDIDDSFDDDDLKQSLAKRGDYKL